MGRQVVGVTVQKQTHTILGVGYDSAVECQTDPDDCCSGSGDDGACCDGPNNEVLYFSSWPTADPETFVDIDGISTLIDEPGQQYAQLIDPNEQSGISLSMKIICVGSGRFRFQGTVEYEELGPIYFDVAAPAETGYLIATVVIPGYGDATVAVSEPCSDGGGGGEFISFCGCTSLPSTLYVEFGGALAGYGTQTLTWDPLLLQYAKSPAPTGICGNSLNYAIALGCAGGSTFRLSMPASPGTGISDTATPVSCSPLDVNFTGTTVGLVGPAVCAGAYTAQVRTTP